MKQYVAKFMYVIILAAMACHGSGNEPNNSDTSKATLKPPVADVTLTVPTGFTAAVFADGLGKARHIVVTPSGYVYVKLDGTRNKGTIARLKDTNGDGVADEELDFGSFKGTGIGIRNGWLYASSNTSVFRFKLNDDGTVANPAQPETIVTGLIERGEHEAKAFALDPQGNIYVNIGAYSNSCQMVDRQKGSMGMKPCPILDSAGGVWKFSGDKQNQTYADGQRYATGLRNVVGLDWNTATQSLFVMQHGRDQLNMFPQWDDKSNAVLPAECMYELHQGSDAGWPYIYFDPAKGQKMLNPEYGGDGVKTGGDSALNPVVAFPAHLAPTDFYFIPAHSSRRNTATVHSSRSMVHGTAHLNPRPAFMWCLFLSATESLPVIGKYLQTDFPAGRKKQLPAAPRTGPADLHRGLTVQFM